MALIKDKSFAKYVKQYAESEDKFFEESVQIHCPHNPSLYRSGIG